MKVIGKTGSVKTFCKKLSVRKKNYINVTTVERFHSQDHPERSSPSYRSYCGIAEKNVSQQSKMKLFQTSYRSSRHGWKFLKHFDAAFSKTFTQRSFVNSHLFESFHKNMQYELS